MITKDLREDARKGLTKDSNVTAAEIASAGETADEAGTAYEAGTADEAYGTGADAADEA